MIHILTSAARWTWTGGYNIVSGPLADITLIGLVGVAYRYVNCHVDGCKRLGLHHAADGRYRVCRAHHPDVPTRITASHIHAEHHKTKPPTITLHHHMKP